VLARARRRYPSTIPPRVGSRRVGGLHRGIADQSCRTLLGLHIRWSRISARTPPSSTVDLRSLVPVPPDSQTPRWNMMVIGAFKTGRRTDDSSRAGAYPDGMPTSQLSPEAPVCLH